MNLIKLKSFSCVNNNNDVFFYNGLGDLIKMNLIDRELEVIKYGKEQTSIFSIFRINEDIYRISNEKNEILDINDNVCIKIEEINAEEDYYYFSKQFNDSVIIYTSNRSIFIISDIKTGRYKKDIIPDDLEFVSVFDDKAVFIASDGFLWSYYFENCSLNKSDIKCTNVDIISVSEHYDNSFYLFDSKGDIYKCNENSAAKVEYCCNIDNNPDDYLNIHNFGNNIFLLPRTAGNRIIVIKKEQKYKASFVDFPEDAEFMSNEPYLFIRYSSDAKSIIYPMRGLNYFLIINKEKGILDWVSPCNIEQTIKLINKEKRKLSLLINEEMLITLEDFLLAL